MPPLVVAIGERVADIEVDRDGEEENVDSNEVGRGEGVNDTLPDVERVVDTHRVGDKVTAPLVAAGVNVTDSEFDTDTNPEGVTYPEVGIGEEVTVEVPILLVAAGVIVGERDCDKDGEEEGEENWEVANGVVVGDRDAVCEGVIEPHTVLLKVFSPLVAAGEEDNEGVRETLGEIVGVEIRVLGMPVGVMEAVWEVVKEGEDDTDKVGVATLEEGIGDMVTVWVGEVDGDTLDVASREVARGDCVSVTVEEEVRVVDTQTV